MNFISVQEKGGGNILMGLLTTHCGKEGKHVYRCTMSGA
ncbi:hypothetical protein KP509_25G042700 [Ceratopteris richardii]|uniref:Uncharacterized protein n=1 Tax=Ceratopteris richardii TaxID=49495 RepID=A0A8T2RPK8_CERRI|nr:hypothetical protein KP509_25G042700 [Ceratopteris richardii]